MPEMAAASMTTPHDTDDNRLTAALDDVTGLKYDQLNNSDHNNSFAVKFSSPTQNSTHSGVTHQRDIEDSSNSFSHPDEDPEMQGDWPTIDAYLFGGLTLLAKFAIF